MGKIKVEDCIVDGVAIEGLKVITPTVFGDDRGYFVPQNICHTKTPGIFVAGDCCAKTLRQVATACSDGAYAAIAACDYLK